LSKKSHEKTRIFKKIVLTKIVKTKYNANNLGMPNNRTNWKTRISPGGIENGKLCRQKMNFM